MSAASPEGAVAVMADRWAKKIAAELVQSYSSLHYLASYIPVIKAGILDVLKEHDAAKDERIAELEGVLREKGAEFELFVGQAKATADVVNEMRGALLKEGHRAKEFDDVSAECRTRWASSRLCCVFHPPVKWVDCPGCAALAKADALLAEPAAGHHEHCDILDPIIKTKPCNCCAEDKARGGGR